jgi:hypothetical protein
MVKADRARGILSKADRRLLTGESDIEPKSQQERNARARIRERLGAGLRDFELLADPAYLEDRDLKRVREPSDTPAETESEELVPEWRNPDSTQTEEPHIDPEITNALIEIVAFTFRMKPKPLYLERVLKAGLRRGLDRLQPNAELSELQISIEDPVTLADRLDAYLDAGWSLSEWEVIFALKNDIRPAEDIAAHVRTHGTRDDDWTPGNSRHQLPFPAACPDCGGNIDEQGYCTECGTFVRYPAPASSNRESTGTDSKETDIDVE